jgi:multiple sugar transport system ATP-binding protein
MDGKIIKKDGELYFDEGSFSVKILEAMYTKLEPYIDKEVAFGIRPENIYDRLFASNATPDNTLNALCDVMETMGSENHLYLSTNKHTIVAVVEASNKPSIGSMVEVVFDMEKVHFFDPSTEKTIV